MIINLIKQEDDLIITKEILTETIQGAESWH
jgi:hypothetical protein